MKKLVMLLIGGFVGISVSVAFIPLITGTSVAAITNPVSLAAITVAQWMIPLAAAVAIVLFGVSRLRKRG